MNESNQFSLSLRFHTVSKAIEEHLRNHGLNPSQARQEESGSLTWHFTLEGSFSCLLRLYRYAKDGQLYFNAECIYGLIDESPLSTGLLAALMKKNGKMPFPVRLAISGKFLSSQAWFRVADQLNVQGLPSLIDLVVDIAFQAREEATNHPGYQPLVIDESDTLEKVH